jgi:hypothetical protein
VKLETGVLQNKGAELSLQLREQLRFCTGFPFNVQCAAQKDNHNPGKGKHLSRVFESGELKITFEV